MTRTDPGTRDGSTILGFAAIATAAFGWAVAAVVARRLFDDGVEPFELSAARSVIAALGLSFIFLRPNHIRRPVPAARIVVLGLSIALVNLVYYLAIERLSVAIALVLQYTAPVLVVTWTALARRQTPSRDITIALLSAVAGVALVVELIGGEIDSLSVAGLAFGFASAIFFACYSLLAESVGRTYGAVGAMARAFAIAAAFWILFQIPRGWPDELFTTSNVPRVLFVGVAGTLAPFLLYVWGIGRVRAERATITATLEPVFAAGAAWLWLNQSLTPTQIVGGLLVLGAVCVLQLRAGSDSEQVRADTGPRGTAELER